MIRPLMMSAALAAIAATAFWSSTSAVEVNVQADPARVTVDSNRVPGAITQQPVDGEFADSATHSDTIVRASTIIGCTVYNGQNESIGSVDDVVVDTKSGVIRYAAVSMGGFLGMGDKLFAVPWKSLRCERRDGEHVCVLPVNKEQLNGAEGFDQDNWPNMADRDWQSKNDRLYGNPAGF
ncbi:MAG: PRC-barrel domain-containing protein [Lacipirellulaceae bacterium]